MPAGESGFQPDRMHLPVELTVVHQETQTTADETSYSSGPDLAAGESTYEEQSHE